MKYPSIALSILVYLILVTSCNNRKDVWNPVNVLSGFTLRKVSPSDSIVYKSANQFSYYDTLKVNFAATYRLTMPRISDCKFNITYDHAKSNCSLNQTTHELTYTGLTAVMDSIKIDITDPWLQHKYVFLNINNKANLTGVAIATISQKFVTGGYEITIDASKSYDSDANLGGKIINYEYTIGSFPAVKITKPIYIDTIPQSQFGNTPIQVSVQDNDNALNSATIQFNVGLSDNNQHIYPVAVIGTQVWMAANLMTTKYSDGTGIINRSDSATWSTTTTGGYGTGNGILYNWYAVTNTKHVCPTGWHVPNMNEWNTLITYLGGPGTFGKHVRNSTWAGDNSSGFSASSTGVIAGAGVYTASSVDGYWWSTSTSDDTHAVQLHLSNIGNDGLQNGVKTDGNAVRCLKD